MGVPVVMGAMGLIYSVCTDYESGVVHKLSMRTHLTLHYVMAALLAASPWLFGFSGYVYLPHLIMAILVIGAAMVTDPVPSMAYKTEDHQTGSHRPHSAHYH